MTRQCESAIMVTAGVHWRCILNAGHSGRHSDGAGATWDDPPAANEPDLLDVVRHRAERNAAERDAALNALFALRRQLKARGGYSTTNEQAEIRYADALLAEHGRSVP